MEAEPSHPADGERSGRQQQPLSAGAAESPTGSCPPQPQQPPSIPRPVHGGLGRLHHRKPKRSDLLLRLQHQHKTHAAAWQLSTDTPGPSGGSISSPSTSSLQSSSTQGHNTQGVQSQPNQEAPEGSPSKRSERKPQKPGKYVCTYCGRPCAKPSVLQKHIRSHTGERPYPCVPCGFSFKTKSNLYKHRKSHTHRIKAGLASSRDELSLSRTAMSAPGEDPEEPTEGESTDSESSSGQYRKERLGKQKSSSSLALLGQEEGQGSDNSQAVKQRLAMRLSERKRGPMASPESPPSSSTSSSLGPSSKGSQESGYFSLSRSTEMSRADSQVSPRTAKTYAEIILGKYGRLGGQQRGPHHQHAHSSPGMEEKSSMPFSVPKTQVIEHITKLITVNEAVVDTSEIDSVKPRRSSLSRKSSLELPKFSCPKDPYMFEPKGESPSSSMAGQSFFPHVQDVDPSGVQESSSSVPLLRSHSMPTSASQGNYSTTSSWGFCRLSHSFDEQQSVVAEMRVGGQHRLLRRQPAIEVPLGAELSLEEAGLSYAATESGLTRKQQRKGPRLYECKARCKQRESYEAHRGLCTGQPIKELERGEVDGACRDDRPQMMHYKFRALAMAVRKRRKEESLEEDPPSPGPTAVVTCSPATTTAVPSLVEQSEDFSGALSQAEQQQQDRKGISVIQHTSSFEKQESISMESQESSELSESQSTLQKQPQPKSSRSMSRLVRQHNIQVPEILVTVEPDADMVSVSPTATASSSKEPERVVEAFQWPQRSQSMAQLPAEKLPPKKKRLRLAEAAAQSSGESSFESVLLGPRNPSQESNISHSPSRSASFEDMGGKPAEPSSWGSSSTQGSHMLTVPSGPHQQYQPQRDMRRSASEQAPASPQHTDEVVETRSKSFDYGSLSAQRSASAWRERRKCLLVKHATLGEPDHEEGAVASHSGRPGSPKPGPSYTSHPALHPAEASSSRLSPEAIGKTVQLFHQPRIPPFPMQPTGHDRFPLGQIAQLHPVTTAISDVLSTHIIHRAFLHTHPSPPTIQVHPGQLHMAECLSLPLDPFSALLSLQYPTGAGETVYLPISPGLTIQVPTQPPIPSTVVLPSPSPQSLIPLPCLHPPPVIATCLAQLMPVVSLVVPVRLQTHMTTYASALYTTLSQILASACSQEPICCMAMVIMGQLEQDKLQRSYLKIPTPDFKSYLPLSLPLELGSVSREGYGPLGAGGSKRMLSPAASLELSTEAQRQQKRVKEEEEEEEKVGEEEENRGTGGEPEAGEDEEKQPERAQIGVVTVKVEEEEKLRDPEGHREEREMQGKAEPKKEKGREKNESRGVSASFVTQSPERAKAPSYTSLHTTTSVSWCYLNYVKPNPSAQRESQTSVYTSWSISMHNPNLPGLSTKLALSLLSSKQKHSSETYTMATALTPATGKVVSASSRKTYISEVHAIPPSTPVEVKEPPQQPEKGKREEQGPSTSKQSEPLRVKILEGGYKSNEEYVYVRGRGRGNYVCGECGIRCKKPSMLRKHIRTHTDLRPYICKHCNFAFKTKGNLTKHMKSKAHGKKCQSMGTSGSSLDEPETEEAGVAWRTGVWRIRHSVSFPLFSSGGIEAHLSGSEDQDEHQFSDVDDSEEDDDEEEEESSSHDELPSSCSEDRSLSARGHSSSGRRSQQGTPDPSAPELQPDPSPCPSQELSPSRRMWPSGHTSSPESRRALFSRRGWDASPRAFSPSSESCSPIRSLSPRRELASHNRHLSPSPKKGPSPIRALSPLYPMRPLSPLRPMSPSQYRVLWARASPSPLGVQHRPRSSPSRLPQDIPSMMASDRRQERIGTPSEGQIGPEPCLSFPPVFRLSPSDSPKAQSQSMDRIFSHLPLHSQQARVPYLMISIGGIQMVQARPRSHPTTPTLASSPPMEGFLLGQTRREAPWCRTPRTQGLRTPGDHWSDSQEVVGASQSGLCIPSLTPPIHSKPSTSQQGRMDPGMINTKQYHSSSHSHRSEAETRERWPSHGQAGPSPPPTHRIGQLFERQEPPGLGSRATGSELVERGAKGGDSTNQDQST
ncbi:transcription factor HIVEP3-like isoform X2 [Salvelinus fontinalis]|uniref:transcription factor HIVEP3-like isoform X2 n=1 Tax=Salvelinus fontinalis TaxID=8038 RepID=UPI00248682B2|nr:transcription factor HIVEP3-like isoform X2 [Salvelinus fontinalis]